MVRLLRFSSSAAALVLSVSAGAREHACRRARRDGAVRMAALSTLAVTSAIVAAGCGAGSTETVTVTKHRHRVVTTRTVTATESASSAEPTATNLVVTPDVRALVRKAMLANSEPSQAANIKGPLKGMYYGQYEGVRYAVAAFDLPYVGTTDQPTLFVQLPDQPYFVPMGEVGGAPLDEATNIPCPLRTVWNVGCAEPH
jgi:hypothetical protein